VAAVAAISTAVSLIPAVFHRHAAAAAAANPSKSGIPSLPLALACSALCAVSEANARERSLRVERAWGSDSSAPLLLLQKELAAERLCHCRHCRQPGHFPLTNWQQRP